MEEKKKASRDLTSFLLEWRDTCAIDLCSRSATSGCRYKREGEDDQAYAKRIAEDVAFVHGTTDARFRRLVMQVRAPDKVGLAKKWEEERKREAPEDALDEDAPIPGEDAAGPVSDPEEDSVEEALDDLAGTGREEPGREEPSVPDPDADPVTETRTPLRGQMVSEYLDVVQGWRSGERRRTRAFHILEGFLYGRQSISGRPFKEYLFEVVAARNGVGPVWGYLYKRVISTMVDKSFRTVTGARSDIGDETSVAVRPDETWSARWAAAYQAGVDEAADALFRWTSERWPGFDINDKLALLCTIFEVSMNDSRVTAMTTVGRQAFYNRKAIARQALQFLFDDGFERDEVLKLLAGPFQSMLLKIAGSDPDCGPFLAFLAENAAEVGK